MCNIRDLQILCENSKRSAVSEILKPDSQAPKNMPKSMTLRFTRSLIFMKLLIFFCMILCTVLLPHDSLYESLYNKQVFLIKFYLIMYCK